jgi:hypothetical protein
VLRGTVLAITLINITKNHNTNWINLNIKCICFSKDNSKKSDCPLHAWIQVQAAFCFHSFPYKHCVFFSYCHCNSESNTRSEGRYMYVKEHGDTLNVSAANYKRINIFFRFQRECFYAGSLLCMKLNLCSIFHSGKLIVYVAQIFHAFMEHNGLLSLSPGLQEHLAGPQAEPLQFIYFLVLLNRTHSNLIITSTINFQSRSNLLTSSCFRTKILHEFLISNYLLHVPPMFYSFL